MKNIIRTTLFAAALLMTAQSCTAQKTIVLNREVETDSGKMLLGHQSLDQFSKEPYSEWYTKEYNEYFIDKKAVEELKKENLNSFNILVFVGTWCSDSHREFPRLIRILDELKYPESRLTIIGVNRKKESPTGDEGIHNVHKVPTIIVSKYGKEIGRIIESTQSGFLERDLLDIVKKYDPSIKDILK